MRRGVRPVALLLLLGGVLWLRAERRQAGEAQAEVMNAVRVRGKAPPLAGVSARSKVEVAALEPRRIGADTTSPEYHRYMNRCMACHDAPAPDLHTRAEWLEVVRRMDANMRAAGTLGLRGDDGDAVLRFLERHGR